MLDEVGLHNLNGILVDNSVVLNWVASYNEYEKSELFKMADQMLRGQQLNPNLFALGECWNKYFPYKIINQADGSNDDSFIDFIRYSFHRPRDIIMLLKIVKEYCPENALATSEFPKVNFQNSKVQKAYSEYLVREIRDSLYFYQDITDFETFKHFFRILKPQVGDRKTFSYDNFCAAFESFKNYIEKHKHKPISPIYENADKLLQTLFELNIISYLKPATDLDAPPRNYWHFRMRTSTDIRPQVKYECNYRIHQGLAVAFDIG